MRTALDSHDCILISEWKPVEKGKDGEIIMHQNKVNRIIIYTDKYDHFGNRIGCDKTEIDFFLLNKIIEKINEIESQKQLMEIEGIF